MQEESKQRPSIKAIFLAAREQTDLEQRNKYLQEVVGDDEALLHRIERMLTAETNSKPNPLDRAIGTLDPEILESTEFTPVTLEKTSQIGPYKLRHPLGAGGMGEVFVAEQTEPVRRVVAIKLIKRGMDTREVIARFEAERQALALMNHPNIAKVLEAGETDDGRPYFVMDLVRGIPITEYCDQHKLSLRERLALFVCVCEAVQHAHQKGVIHRDLKPSNILVELHDVRHVPKVIDFGVAKATNQRLTERTLFTQFSQMIGTPLYMSPEQAELSGLDVDTRSDVYSLGVLLYELLTGTTPFNKELLKQAGFDEMRRIIREDVPPRPSHRVSTLSAEALSTISECRRSDVRRLKVSLSRELDWIVVKALDKDRTRRYESASALAADVNRLLRDEPVTALPPSIRYRLGKFARRHRVMVTSAATIVSVMLIALAVISWKWNDERLSRREAEAQRKLAAENLELAQDGLDSALAAVDQLLTNVAEDRLLNEPHMETLRRQLLEDAVVFCQSLAERRADNRRVQQQVADAQLRLGQIYETLGDHRESMGAYQRAANGFEGLATASPQNTDLTTHAMQGWIGAGRASGAKGTQQLSEAERSLRRALKIGEASGDERPANVDLMTALAEASEELCLLLVVKGEHTEADALFKSALNIRTSLLESAPLDSRFREGLVDSLTSAPQLRVTHLGQAEQLLKELLEQDAKSVELRSKLAGVWLDLGGVLFEEGKQDEAEESWNRAMGSYSELAKEHPNVPTFGGRGAGLLANLALLALSRNHVDEAKRHIEESASFWERLVEKYPTTNAFKYDLLKTWSLHGKVLEANGEYKESLEQFQRARQLAEQLSESTEDLPTYRLKLAEMYSNLAISNPDPSQRDEALRLLRKGLSVAQQVSKQEGGSLRARKVEGTLMNNLGNALLASGEFQEAQQMLSKCIASCESGVSEFPKLIVFAELLEVSLRNLGDLSASQGKNKSARGFLSRALRANESLANRISDRPKHRQRRATYHVKLARLTTTSDRKQSLFHFESARQILNGLTDDFPESPSFQSSSAVALAELSIFQFRGGEFADAESTARQAIERLEKLMESYPEKVAHRQNAATTNLLMGHILRKKDLPAAISHYRRAADLQPSNPASRIALGQSLSSVRDEESRREAIRILEKLAADAPENLDALLALATAYGKLAAIQSGPYEDRIPVTEKGLRIAQQLIEDHPGRLEFQRAYASAMINLGHRLHTSGRKAEARPALEKARSYCEQMATDHPTDKDCQRAYAVSLENLGDYFASEEEWSKAVELAREAIEVQPNEDDHWGNLGVALYRTGDFHAAAQTLEKARQMRAGKDLVQQFFLAMTYWQLGDMKKARELYGRAAAWFELRSNSGHIDLRSEAEELLGLDAPGRAALIEGYYTRSFPKNPTPQDLIDRGDWFRKQGLHDKAIESLTEAIELDPDNSGAYHRRALSHNFRADFRAAISDASQAIKLSPSHKAAYTERAWANIETGNYEQAIADCSEAIRLNPKSFWGYVRRSRAYHLSGRHREAVRDAKKAIDIDPASKRAYERLADAHIALGQLEAARQAYHERLKIDPDHFSLWPGYCELLVLNHDLVEYRRFCRALLQRHAETKKPAVARAILKSVIVAPDAVEDWATVIRLAELAGETGHVAMLARAGKFDQAIEFHNALIARRGGEPNAWNYLWLAMIEHGRGNQSKARELLSEGIKRIDGDPTVQDNLRLKLWRQEFAALIEPKPEEE